MSVTITPYNEFTPAFTGTPYTVSVPETEAYGNVIKTVAATDQDSGPDGVILFSIVSVTPGSGATMFGIDKTSGAVSDTGK